MQQIKSKLEVGDWVAVQRPYPNWRGLVLDLDRVSGEAAIAVRVAPRNCEKVGFEVFVFAIDDVRLLRES